jgi:hypothetical protein
MKVRLRTTAGVLAVVSAATLVAVGTWLGCHGNYGTSNGGLTTNDFLTTGRTLSFFTAIQVDPRSEDSAGPQFVVAEDLDSDGLLDLVSAWNQSQPVQIHLQRRSATGAISFETVTLAGNIPVVAVAGLAVADFDQDGAPDIAVLIKESLISGAGCLNGAQPEPPVLNGVILMYFGPADATQVTQALAWRDQQVKSSFLAGCGDSYSPPEEDGYTSMAVGDMDGDGDLDIVVAWNPHSDCNDCPGVLLFTNDGPGAVQKGDWPVAPILDPFECPPLVDPEQVDAVYSCTVVKSVALGDVDRDGDLDIVVTFPAARSMNVRWYRNPVIDVPDDCHCDPLNPPVGYDCPNGSWFVGTVGQVEPRSGFTPSGGADIIKISDVDADGILDVVVRSTGGKIIQWLKGPECPTTPTTAALTDPFRNIPWRVYTIAEFTERTPEGLAVGDLNFDGTPEVITSAAGGLLFLDSQTAPSIYDQWIESLIVDDEPPGQPGDAPPTTDPNVTPTEVAGTTFINSILVVDLDGDGATDLVATFDRSGLSGLSNDALVWFRNTR